MVAPMGVGILIWRLAIVLPSIRVKKEDDSIDTPDRSKYMDDEDITNPEADGLVISIDDDSGNNSTKLGYNASKLDSSKDIGSNPKLESANHIDSKT